MLCADYFGTIVELYSNFALELNVGQIARYAYTRLTGNHKGAKHIAGMDGSLLPEASITKAQTYTNQQSKLETALGSTRAGQGGPRGGKAGGKGTTKGGGFVPLEERVCHYCKQKGHVIADCPKLKALEAKRAAAPKADKATEED